MESYSRNGCVRQENACLNMQDEHLISDLDAMQYEFASSMSQVCPRGPRIGVKNGVAFMREQIHQLQAKLESQATELKAAELRADCSQEAAAHCDILVASLTEELSSLREELENNSALGKRAEQQRNQALQNAEQLKEAFKDYRATISIKLKRVMASESQLKDCLVECDREKEEFEMKCSVMEKGKVEQSQTISQLKEEGRQVQSVAAGLQAQLEDARHKVSHLERQHMERDTESRELGSLRKELENLRTVTQNQEQQAAQSHREAQQSREELASLEAVLSLLHLREGAVGTLCVRPCLFPPVNYLGTTHLLKLKPGEGYQQLLRGLQAMEAERTNQSGLIERLQERLSRTQEEISSLQSSMSQRASHYQSLHTELLDKVSQAAATEKEEKTSNLQHYQSLMTKKQKEYQQSLDKCKQSQSQQLMEQQHRIEMLQQSGEEARSQMLLMERELSSLQRERDEAQDAVLLLQSSMVQLTQRQVEVRDNEEMLQSFKEQAAQSASTVSELQASLSACREELNVCLLQMDKMKKNYESELQKNKDRVSSLQEKLHGAGLVCQSSAEQNLQLQLSLQRQQTMLTESAAHISELEDSQSQLQTQVSSLEQQLERSRASLQGEARNRERDAQEKDEELQEMKQQNIQLSEAVGPLRSEVTKCRGELASKESELQRLRKDVDDQACQVRCRDESLQHMKKQLDGKSDAGMDLEEKLHRCEADRLNCVQRAQTLEAQLQAVQRDSAETLEQLRELRDVLQRTQTIADERHASVEKLTLGQLEVSLREHKQEMQRKVESLQQSLQARERELTDRHVKEEELAVKEAELQSMVTSLELELDLEKEQHSKELEALQQTRGQLLKVSEHISSTMISSQEQLAAKLQQSQNQLEDAKTEVEQTKTQLERTRDQVGHLQACREQTQTQLLQSKAQLERSRILCEESRDQNSLLVAQLEQLSTQLNQAKVQLGQLQTELQAFKTSRETSRESLLIKESEATRLQARISCLERAADHKHLYSLSLSPPARHTFTRSPENSSSSHFPAASPQKLQTSLPSSKHAHSTCLLSSTHSQTCSSPPAHTYLQPLPDPHPAHPTCDWLHRSSIDSSLDLPPSLKATLREAMGTRLWESSTSSSSSSSFPSTADHSWQGLSNMEATATSDLSFNPLTYRVDKRDDINLSMEDGSVRRGDEEQASECESTLVGQQEDMSSLTGMLKFVNQTLAMQEDPSLWSSTGLQPAHILQRDVKET
ncbi:Cytoskeletal protein Sojo [Liparis tanakae]|uniref:Cytoskeletal protein Sojo n=1 Tax=Liparis tanakae TaxID=230148 RepID=A0A4Z2HVV0_9TELE|nr:Cytoskeletal protein Sojo [Liparis tanakae]